MTSPSVIPARDGAMPVPCPTPIVLGNRGLLAGWHPRGEGRASDSPAGGPDDIADIGGFMKVLRFALIGIAPASTTWAGNPFKVEDIEGIKRVGEAPLSPDTIWGAFTVSAV